MKTTPQLIQQGKYNLALAERNMGALMQLRARFAKEKPFKGVRIGMALHLTKETGILVRSFIDGGAKVAITSCNPLSSQDDVIAALQNDGIEVYGYKGETTAEYYKFLNKVLATKPQVTIDDGCDLVSEIHLNHKDLLKGIIGGTEETTTGVQRLIAMQKDGALKYPVIAVNDNKTKHLMDNYYGTGQSTLDAILRATNILFSGKTVVVAGYGSCGKGVALRAKGMGARVIVTEVQPFPALQARMDGFEVMPMRKAAPYGDLFITVTGNCEVITLAEVALMKDGAILANSGHFNVEITVDEFDKKADKKVRVRPFLDEYTFGKKTGIKGKETKKIFVVGEGRLANLVAAEGHPSEVMSLSFCGQALAVEYILKYEKKLSAGVHDLPAEYDEKIAQLQLDAMNTTIDSLTKRQKQYISCWQEGT